MAKKYYPAQWNDARIDALVESGKLTQDEADHIRGGNDVNKIQGENN